MYYVYFLLLEGGNVYTGYTSNLRRRLGEHRYGKVRSTRGRRFKLIGYEAYLIKEDAERREKFLKSTEGKRLFRMQYKAVLNAEVMGVGSPCHSTGQSR